MKSFHIVDKGMHLAGLAIKAGSLLPLLWNTRRQDILEVQIDMLDSRNNQSDELPRLVRRPHNNTSGIIRCALKCWDFFSAEAKTCGLEGKSRFDILHQHSKTKTSLIGSEAIYNELTA